MGTSQLKHTGVSGGYDYVVNGREFTNVAVPLIYMAAGLQRLLSVG